MACNAEAATISVINFSILLFWGNHIINNPVFALDMGCQESKEVIYWTALWNFGVVVLFLDVVDTLAVEEICCRPRIMSTGFVRPEDLVSMTILGVQ